MDAADCPAFAIGQAATQDLVGAVYLGFDQPRSLGGYAQGGSIAAPMFKQFIQQTRNRWSDRPFVAPANIHWVKIDRVSGKKVFAGDPTNDPKSGIIWEAFKPESEPRRTIREEEIKPMRTPKAATGPAKKSSSGRTDSDFLDDRGGII